MRRGAQRGELRRGQGCAFHGDAVQSVRSADGNRSRGGLGGVAHTDETDLIDRSLARGGSVAIDWRNAGWAVGVAIDGEGKHCRAGIAIRIGDGVAIGFGERLAGLQCVHCRQGVVQRVGIGAVAVQHQRAVGQGDAGSSYGCARRISADTVIGQD